MIMKLKNEKYSHKITAKKNFIISKVLNDNTNLHF